MWPIFTRIGAIPQVTQVLGEPLQALDGQPLPPTVTAESCYFGKSSDLSGAELMLNQGEVVRIDLTKDSSIKTAAGIGIGATPANVEAQPIQDKSGLSLTNMCLKGNISSSHHLITLVPALFLRRTGSR
jgi:hypothetical protein